jgi:hypothetical protein
VIIEPVPLGPPSAPRRRLRALALVVPLVLLGGVVAAGTLGPRPAPSASPPAVAVASADATSPDPAPSTTTTTAPPSPGALPAGVPARIAGLDVLTVGEALELRAAGLLHGVTAIGGHLGVREQPVCSGTFCDRTGILAESPFTAATEFGEIGPHLHPQLPTGVALPSSADIAEAEPARAGAAAPAAVVIARFDDERARRCLPAGRHCGQELVVERVAWVDGESYPAILAIDPAVTPVRSSHQLRSAARAAERGLGIGATPLMTVLVRPGTIAYIDPLMAPFLPDLGPGPVWYVRGLRQEPGAGTIGWVVAEEDGSLLLSGLLPVVRPSAGG